MSIRERIKAEEARQQAGVHHEIERSYSRGWPPPEFKSDFWEIVGCVLFATAGLVAIAYLLVGWLALIR